MKKIDTICVQDGYKPKAGEPRITPIVQSTTFYYEKGQELADLFALKTSGFFYTRLANPTVAVIEEKVANLEGGVYGVGCSSGQSATLMAILNVTNAGDNILSSGKIYGGTYNLFNVTLKKYGIETRFFDQNDSLENIDKLIDNKTRLIFGETISNPTIDVLDFDKISAICKKHKLLFVVDNTLATPVLCRPLSLGANIVVHSTSKYIDGHAAALGGLIIDGGNFEFLNNPRYPEFNTPDDSYNGIVYARDLGKLAFGLKCRLQLMRDLGAMMSPQNAFITTLGCETLALRMRKHAENAKIVAEYLVKNEKVEWIKHPSLNSDKYFELGKKYLPNGASGMLSVGIKGGRENAEKFMNNLKLFAIVTHVADIRSSVIHPASTTHCQLSKQELAKTGIAENLVRISVGIEDAEDLIADLEQALKNV